MTDTTTAAVNTATVSEPTATITPTAEASSANVTTTASPSIAETLVADAEAVYHAAEAGIKDAIATVEDEAPKVASAISGVLSAWVPGWSKLTAKWATFTHKKKLYASAFIAVAGLLVWHVGVQTIYNLLPDHVTHHEVRSASAEAVTAAVGKASQDKASMHADVVNIQEDVGQLKLELKAVQDKLQSMSTVTTGSVPEKKPATAKKTHHYQRSSQADKSSGLSSYLPSWAK